jgi:hypothetical protein
MLPTSFSYNLWEVWITSMKKTFKYLKKTAAVLCMAAFLFTFFGNIAAKAANLKSNEECLTEMAEETNAYMRSKGLQISNSSYSFTNNDGEKVYSLLTNDPVKAGASINRTQSVIHYKNSEGQSEFYVVNLELQNQELTYTFSKESELIDRIKVTIPNVPPDPCAGALTQAQADAILANLLAQANADCITRGTCLFQQMGSSCAYVMYVVKPTSWRCRILVAVDVQAALHKAITKTQVKP